jgi:hypothetical protein
MCKRKLKNVLTGCCLFAVAGHGSLASAAELNDSGTVTYSVSQITHIPLGGGRILTEQRMAGVVVASDSAPPFHLSSQDCLSAGIGDGKGLPDEDNGVCIAVDKDGDAWWLSYTNKGEDRKWTVVSGTGKYAGMTGSGTTKLLAITPDGRMTISWRGAMKMK